LKPAAEFWVVARKPLIGTVAKNVLEHGTGALNIDATRVAFQGHEDKASAKPGGKATARSGALAGKAQAGRHFVIVGPTDLEDGPLYWSNQDGWGGRSTATVFDESEAGLSDPDETVRREWMDDNDGRDEFQAVQGEGRWPSNVILDEEAGRSLDQQTGDLGKSAGGNSRQINVGSGRYGWNTGGKKDEPDGVDPGYGDSGGASRFFYCSKTSKRERNEGMPEGTENRHPTVKPLSLMRYLVRLVTPPGKIVLDPFCGSGSTGCAAVSEGMSFIGVDNDEESVKTSRARIAYWANPFVRASKNKGAASASSRA
jgi:site-specific DNA-methyltransferase (adenine-specific)